MTRWDEYERIRAFSENFGAFSVIDSEPRRNFETTRKRLRTAVLLGVLLFAWGRAQAWGTAGHRIVGEIARQNLTSATAAGVRALLAEDDEVYRTLAGAALWADDTKSDENRTWHYINLPRNARTEQIKQFCGQPNWCVTEAIHHFHRLLMSDADAIARRDALKYLVHFVGDLHQPLHAGNRRDAGGNAVRVTFFGREYRIEDVPYNLHAVWDTSIIRREIGQKHADWRHYADALAAAVTAEERRAWTRTAADDWTLESSRLAFSAAYTAPENIAGRYYENSVGVIEKQLQRAGIRLAALLNRAME